MKLELEGRFRLTVYRPDGSVKKDTDWFKNIILNAGLNRLGTGDAASWCQVGSGSTTPAVNQTALTNLIAATQTMPGFTYGNSEASPWYGWHRRVFRFAAGVAEGVLSEVGIGWGDSGSTLFSRALILDSQGAPTSITILADEVLDVAYEFRMYAPVGDTVYNATVAGVSRSITSRAADVASVGWTGQLLLAYGIPGLFFGATVYNGSLGTIEQSPSGDSAGGPNGTQGAYSNNSNAIDINYTLGLEEGNVAGGIKSIRLGNDYGLGYRQLEFDTAIAKDNTKVFSFSATWSWARKTI